MTVWRFVKSYWLKHFNGKHQRGVRYVCASLGKCKPLLKKYVGHIDATNGQYHILMYVVILCKSNLIHIKTLVYFGTKYELMQRFDRFLVQFLFMLRFQGNIPTMTMANKITVAMKSILESDWYECLGCGMKLTSKITIRRFVELLCFSSSTSTGFKTNVKSKPSKQHC